MGWPSTSTSPRAHGFFRQEDAQEGGLAAAGGADKGNEGARREIEGDVLQHDLLAIFLPEMAHGNGGHFAAPNQGKRARRARARLKSMATAMRVIHAT